MVRPASLRTKNVHSSSLAFMFASVGRHPRVQIATAYLIYEFAPEASRCNLTSPLFHCSNTSVWDWIFLRVIKKGLLVFPDKSSFSRSAKRRVTNVGKPRARSPDANLSR